MSHTTVFSGVDERLGWFKLVIPAIENVFGGMWANPQATLLPFIYAKWDTEQAAFDVALNYPMYALDKVVLVQMDKTRKGDISSREVPVSVVALSVVSSEQESRCYIPAGSVSCIVPVKADHPLVEALVKCTSEGHLVIPSAQETAKILDMSGNPVTSGKV
jgi:hypothetical protein